MANKLVVLERLRQERNELMSEVHQHYGIVMSSIFRSLNLLEVENRAEQLSRAFGDLGEKHTELSIASEPKARGDLERFLLEVEKVYQTASRAYRRRIDTLKRDRHAQSMEWSALHRRRQQQQQHQPHAHQTQQHQQQLHQPQQTQQPQQ